MPATPSETSTKKAPAQPKNSCFRCSIPRNPCRARVARPIFPRNTTKTLVCTPLYRISSSSSHRLWGRRSHLCCHPPPTPRLLPLLSRRFGYFGPSGRGWKELLQISNRFRVTRSSWETNNQPLRLEGHETSCRNPGRIRQRIPRIQNLWALQVVAIRNRSMLACRITDTAQCLLMRWLARLGRRSGARNLHNENE